MAELDLSLLRNVPRKGINLPDSEIQKAITAVKKKDAQEKALEKKVKSLDKIIDKTDKLIAKSKERNNKDKSKSLSNHKQVVNKPDTSHYQKQHNAQIHYSDYLMLKKLPKKIVDSILSKSTLRDGKLEAVVDIDDLRESTGKDENTLRVAIFKLKKRGFFLKVHWSNNGMRVFHLDPKIYQ
tara:strand:+ start:112 stop:657 length:546 start_codon:yes stop_codon:yes gene_type:complete